MDKIYILKKQKLMYGPYTMQKIREKGVKPSDLVWYEGIKDWTPAEKIDFLQDCLISEAQQTTKKKTIIEKVFSFLS